MSKRAWGAGALVWATAAGLLVIGTAAPASAAATETVASWQMNEPAGATTMVDSSGNGINGAIGSAVLTGVVVDGATGYRWTSTQPNQPPPKPERLIQVQNSALNPGTRDFAITIRFRTTHSYGNMIQKGQSGSTTGMFKWQIPNGVISCLFRGVSPTGSMLSRSVNSGPTPLNDGAWHTVRCERTATAVTMTIDGTTVRRANGPTGNITPSLPLTLGGKLNCDQVETTCDYFAGDMDYVLIEASPTTPPPPPPPPGDDIFADDFANGFANWTSVTRMTVDSTTGSPAAPSARA
jgi:hypothetical protein